MPRELFADHLQVTGLFWSFKQRAATVYFGNFWILANFPAQTHLCAVKIFDTEVTRPVVTLHYAGSV